MQNVYLNLSSLKPLYYSELSFYFGVIRKSDCSRLMNLQINRTKPYINNAKRINAVLIK